MELRWIVLNFILSVQVLCFVHCQAKLSPLLGYKALARENGPFFWFSLSVNQTVPTDFSLALELKLVCASAVPLIISMHTVFFVCKLISELMPPTD